MKTQDNDLSSTVSLRRVLIANRGAIACRIIRTLKEMGIESVAVFAEADRESLHVRQADIAVSLGEGAAAATYLDQDKLLAIATDHGADAIHPGYGFLSENPTFVERCEAAGIAFIGPTPQQMRDFGLKHRARELARQAGVPLLPGTELLTDVQQALAAAETIGYPIILKSTAGGGGIGMQVCHSPEQLQKAFDSVKRLSANNFANDGVYLEKFIEAARHIEVQIFGDGKGNALALGERDCSSQRRHQKVIEEAPAPNIPESVRQQLHEVAVALMASVNYRNAGTVEYVYDQANDQFYFLEVNTRLQVEHGVTEQIYGVDLVRWMVTLAAGDLPPLDQLENDLAPAGHAIQMRLYAEDPNKDFQPCAGLLTEVSFPQQTGLRVDGWIEAGVEVSPFFDPMLAKIIVTADDRDQTIAALDQVLADTRIHGIETNLGYVRSVLGTDLFKQGEMITRFLGNYSYRAPTVDVLQSGTLTTIQDLPGRTGYWDIGVPPSGPFDSYSFGLGNRLLGNDDHAAGLEMTLNGATLRFNTECQIVLAGAPMPAHLDDEVVAFWQVLTVSAGQTLRLGKTAEGARSYLLFAGGLDCPDYLGSKSTFTLGQFGGHCGRALRSGDVLRLHTASESAGQVELPEQLLPKIGHAWTLQVIYGPHGAPDFFTPADIDAFFEADWEVHYNSSRTGIRLIGPKPEWARSDGGEAGMHPSNIHDNAYAFGTVDFTGDMPVILGPDGPSLGGFVCPATVIKADLWKLGQLKAGDRVRFVAVDMATANELERNQQQQLQSLSAINDVTLADFELPASPVLTTSRTADGELDITYRPAGDHFLLVEYGEQTLDIAVRFRVHALMLWLQENPRDGIRELTPGIRSLQVHYDPLTLNIDALLDHLHEAEQALTDIESLEVPSRVVHVPLSWDDEACRLAIKKYQQSVRPDAPWCPSNLEFIRRINGLDSIDGVKQIVFNASYLVMGLGDVYLGAPVATPLDPRHRLVTTKYNPARTWTAENSVGIGGSYLCIYGMEGPGGYQFVGRTLQMWNRYRQTREFTQPWLLRFFDQIRFYEVSAEELQQIRRDFPQGDYPLKITETRFSLADYQQFLADEQTSIEQFTRQRETAFAEELERWVASGQINFEASQDLARDTADAAALPDNCSAIESHVAGNVWQLLVQPGQRVAAGEPVAILESMKMEIEVVAPVAGRIHSISRQEGQQVSAGQCLFILQED